MSSTSLARCIRASLLILVTIVCAQAASASPPESNAGSLLGYPRLAFYGSIRGNGYPFIEPDGSLSLPAIDAVSRFDEIILDINPIWPYRPDVLQAIRARNPNARMLGYVVGQNIWQAFDVDSLHHYPTRFRRIVDDNNARLYNRFGQYYYAGNVNLAKRDAGGDLFIADSLALLWKDVTIDSGVWDGIFYDILCDDMGWPQANGDSIDYVRAGYPTFAAFNASWREATDSIAVKMRRWGGDGFTMVGNCALGTKYEWFNGWMREGFPTQAGGDWWANMYQEPGGYFTDERNFRQPRHNYIFSFNVGTDPYSLGNMRIARFGLGSATLGDGFGVFGASDRDAFHADYHEWWYDEYAVDLDAGGQATEDKADTGWLGQPLSDPYQMIWLSTEPDAVTNPSFEANITQGWSMVSFNGGSFHRDVTTAGHLQASLRVDMPNASTVDWYTNLRCPNTIQAFAYNTYSGTFWAKADSPRNISVVFQRGDAGLIQVRFLNITTEWKQYQIPFNSGPYAGPATIAFFLAKDPGSVWLDDIHLQRGTTSIYRRDFQKGIVLVNPSLSSTAAVPLERAYKRITGLHDTVTNDGSVSDIGTVGPSDAIFLIGDDVFAPSRVEDLHAVPLSPGSPYSAGAHADTTGGRRSP